MKHLSLPLLALLLVLSGCYGPPACQLPTPPPEPSESFWSELVEEMRPDPLEDQRCKLYLQVLEDLWAVDPGLNDEATYLGMDLSALGHLSEEQRHAVAEKFAGDHGLILLEDTWEGLRQAGYINKVYLFWEDGIFFSIETNDEAVLHLPDQRPGEEPAEYTVFNAHKWRSGTGAYYFGGCVAQKGADGSWSYTVGQEAIA